jgi:Fe-S cluster biogenesis protein NfuA
MPDLKKQINDILDDVRPSLQMHGGDVALKSVKNGIVELKVTGACHGCAMASITFGEGIGEMLKQKIPAVKEVRY